MREIKFRVWIKDQKRIMPVSNLRVIEGKISVAYGGDFHVYFFEDEIELMQFTGLKDKNGKEIFEGDVVRCIWVRDYGHSDVIGQVKSVDGCFTVEFNEPQFDVTLKCERPRLYVKCFSANHGITVIGNIYETPTLLEQEKRGKNV